MRNIFIFSVLFLSLGIGGQTPVLLKEINPGSSSAMGDDIIEHNHVINLNGKIYFNANDGTSGKELWISDGTSTGTMMLKDINPGTASSLPDMDMTVLNGKVYFIAKDDSNENEIWVTDGTTAGTQKVVGTSANISNPFSLVATSSNLYFAAKDKVTNNTVLWISDGTAAGTKIVQNNSTASISGGFSELVADTDAVYFTHFNTKGCLYKCDASAITEIACIDPTASATIKNITPIGGGIYFAYSDNGSINFEPFVSDGTAAGTLKLKEITSGNSSGSDPRWFTAFKGKVYFSTNTALWRTDGTASGTEKFADIQPTQYSNDPGYMLANADYMYLPGKQGTTGFELYRTDGTVAGTTLVKDLATGSFSSSPSEFALANGLLYFQAIGDSGGPELYVSNGTSAGTKLVADINTTPFVGSQPRKIQQLGNSILFIATTSDHGSEWYTLTIPVSVFTAFNPSFSFTIYPNPSSNEVEVERPVGINGSILLKVVDVSGRCLFTQKMEGDKITMPVTKLAHGQYWILMQSDGFQLGIQSFYKN